MRGPRPATWCSVRAAAARVPLPERGRHSRRRSPWRGVSQWPPDRGPAVCRGLETPRGPRTFLRSAGDGAGRYSCPILHRVRAARGLGTAAASAHPVAAGCVWPFCGCVSDRGTIFSWQPSLLSMLFQDDMRVVRKGVRPECLYRDVLGLWWTCKGPERSVVLPASCDRRKPPVNRRGRKPLGGQTSGESPRASWSWLGRLTPPLPHGPPSAPSNTTASRPARPR